MEVVGSAAPLAHVPLVEVGDLRGEVRRAAPVRLGVGRQRVSERVCGGNVSDVGGRGRRGLAVHFHVLPQRAGVRVGLVTAADFAVVRLVTGVDVGVLLPVAAVGEFSVTAVKLALERFLSLNKWETDAVSVTCNNVIALQKLSWRTLHIYISGHFTRLELINNLSYLTTH